MVIFQFPYAEIAEALSFLFYSRKFYNNVDDYWKNQRSTINIFLL